MLKIIGGVQTKTLKYMVSGNVNVTPWLILNLNANPVHINNSETSNITS